MPASNLAKIFGPTIVGYSTSDPEPIAMLNETKQQAMVRTALRQIPAQQH
jgi:Rac GTPase-activating protein 1